MWLYPHNKVVTRMQIAPSICGSFHGKSPAAIDSRFIGPKSKEAQDYNATWGAVHMADGLSL